jgi:hypothetical protein
VVIVVRVVIVVVLVVVIVVVLVVVILVVLVVVILIVLVVVILVVLVVVILVVLFVVILVVLLVVAFVVFFVCRVNIFIWLASGLSCLRMRGVFSSVYTGGKSLPGSTALVTSTGVAKAKPARAATRSEILMSCISVIEVVFTRCVFA